MVQLIEATGAVAPFLFLLIFLLASALMIYRLEALGDRGFEGTALGALIMPYCSGLGNLLFVWILARTPDAPAAEAAMNSLVNNVTNVTLLLGLPALFWGLHLVDPPPAPVPSPAKKPNSKKKPKKKPTPAQKKQEQVKKKKETAARQAREMELKIDRLSLVLTMVAVLFFSGIAWALGRDGVWDFGDGVVLIGVFIFWQCFQVYDVMKNNLRKKHKFSLLVYLDLLLLAAGAWLLYISVDWLTAWVSSFQSGFISSENLGWLSGWLMVLPNALLALYYGWKHRADVVYSSQIGDGHICIPFALGLFAVVRPLPVPAFFHFGISMIVATTCVHLAFILFLKRLPRLIGLLFALSYLIFLYYGFA